MRLSAFIRVNTPQIISEWENFARTLIPAAETMSPSALRDHIREILHFIVDDIESTQTPLEQLKKSHGEKARTEKTSAAEIHASLRHAGGFTLGQLVSEYRSLRASVVKLWFSQMDEVTHQDLLDLTRFHEAIDQALTESMADYTKKLEHSRNMFLGILSHDLRSPIATAHMSAELAMNMKDANLNDNQKILVSQVMDCTDRATEMINYLLDLTRVRLGTGLPIITSPMNMGLVSKQLVDEMRTKHPDHSINLKISGNTEGKWDKHRIGQIFSNLLGNAIQYSAPGSPIDITVEGISEEVELSVHNNGIPISPSSLDKIFESLIRGEDGERYNPPGSINLGLGLYITKEIVAAHNGAISVTSSEDEGTTFTVRLPRNPHQRIVSQEISTFR